MTLSQVWTEKYKPKCLEDVLIGEKEKEYLLSLTSIPNNLLLSGGPGIGKTTIAKLLSQKFAPMSYLYIKASEEGNIETIRTTIADFISVSSIDGAPKVVILDEADGISHVAQKALRGVMEDYLDHVRFILTANYKSNLIEAIQSRCSSSRLTLSCPIKVIFARIVQILKEEKISVPADQRENLKSLVKDLYPDIRLILNELQVACHGGTFQYNTSSTGKMAKSIKDDLDNGVNVFTIRQSLVDNIGEFRGNFHSLMKDLFNLYVKEMNVVASLVISEHMYRDATVQDPEVNFSAMLFTLSQKLKK